ncbi:hypothetical protein AMP9_3674 [plant metagenome]|uniref:Uncharacterized protein n=1 Tax=plant metagenome TaxID=1297885 RepID=A0A484PVP3_9ZZZZ
MIGRGRGQEIGHGRGGPYREGGVRAAGKPGIQGLDKCNAVI